MDYPSEYRAEIERIRGILDRVKLALRSGKKHIDAIEQPYLAKEYDDLIQLCQ